MASPREAEPTRQALWILIIACLMVGAVGGAMRSRGLVAEINPAAGSSALDAAVDGLVFEAPIPAGRLSRPGVAPAQRPVVAGLGFAASDGFLRITRHAADVERLAEEAGGAERLHALGLLRLVEGRLDQAVLFLEGASLEDAENADFSNDLAAAYLSRFQEQGVELDLFETLRYAQRAVAIDPESPAAAFNHAQALTLLFVREQALRAWAKFLRLEPTGAWSDRARNEVRALRHQTVLVRWERLKAAILASPSLSPSQAEEIVTDFPQSARRLVIEELMPRWVRSYREGPQDEERHLQLAREIGEGLSEKTGDATIAEAVAAVDAAQRMANTTTLNELAAAHAALGEGERLYYEYELDRAVPLLRKAEDLFRRTGSPLGGVAAFHVAAVTYNRDPAGAAEVFVRIQKEFPGERYPVLVGFCDWMLGTIESITGDSERAIELYERALRLLEQAAPDHSGAVYVLLAEAHRLLGRDDAAWRAYLPGLRWSFERGDPARYHMALYSLTESLLERGEVELAKPFSEELAANAKKTTNPLFLAEAHLQMGRVKESFRQPQVALLHFQEAARWAQELEAGDLRGRIASTVELAEAEALIEEDPPGAIERLNEVLSSKLTNGYLYQLPRAYAARARAHQEAGLLAAAERDLEHALAEHERLSFETSGRENRRMSSQLAHDLIDHAVAFQLDRLESPQRALEVLERGRPQWLIPAAGRSEAGTGMELTSSPRISAGAAPPDRSESCGRTVDIHYAILPERLLIWLFDGTSMLWHEVPVKKEALRRLVLRLENVVARGASEQEYKAVAGDLYEALVRPVAGFLTAEAEVNFIPDDFLIHVPFGGLHDATTKTYFIERHAVTISLGLSKSDPPPEIGVPPRRELKILVMAGGGDRWQGAPSLEVLGGALAEAEDLTTQYLEDGVRVDQILSKAEMIARLPEYDLAHFAGHGVTDQATGRAGIGLAGKGGEVLWGDEVAHLDLRTMDLVVLSSCRSLGVMNSMGRFDGLAFKFLSAGVSAVVAAGWQVEDRLGGSFMVQFHHSLSRGLPVAEALRRVQVRHLRSHDPARLDPQLWAAFRLISGPSEDRSC